MGATLEALAEGCKCGDSDHGTDAEELAQVVQKRLIVREIIVGRRGKRLIVRETIVGREALAEGCKCGDSDHGTDAEKLAQVVQKRLIAREIIVGRRGKRLIVRETIVGRAEVWGR